MGLALAAAAWVIAPAVDHLGHAAFRLEAAASFGWSTGVDDLDEDGASECRVVAVWAETGAGAFTRRSEAVSRTGRPASYVTTVLRRSEAGIAVAAPPPEACDDCARRLTQPERTPTAVLRLLSGTNAAFTGCLRIPRAPPAAQSL